MATRVTSSTPAILLNAFFLQSTWSDQVNKMGMWPGELRDISFFNTVK